MTEDSIQEVNGSQFKNGNDIHFDYNPDISNTESNSTPIGSNSKRKKKKKKNKSKMTAANVEVSINDPEEEYPSSRVIKQAPNGDVIVERLPEENENYGRPHRHHYTVNIWDNASLEEQENLRQFWESLDQESKIKLVKIDKESIMEIFRNEAKIASMQNHNGAAQTSSIGNSCQCKYCGRKNSIIEDELENIYDNHFDDIIDFIHEIRDINDLNALPSLLFGGFHMLEEEHKLQRRQQKAKVTASMETNHNSTIHPDDHSIEEEAKEIEAEIAEINEDFEEEVNEGNGNHNIPDQIFEDIRENRASNPGDDVNRLQSNDVYSQLKDLHVNGESHTDVAISELLSPYVIQALKTLKPGNNASDIGSIESSSTMDEQFIFREIVDKMHHADKSQLQRELSLLQNEGENSSVENSSALPHKFNDLFSKGLMALTEDLLTNDGNSFINMMEALKKARNTREGLLKTGNDNSLSTDDDASYNMKEEKRVFEFDEFQVAQLQRDLNKISIDKGEINTNIERMEGKAKEIVTDLLNHSTSFQKSEESQNGTTLTDADSLSEECQSTHDKHDQFDEVNVIDRIGLEEEQDEFDENEDLSDTESEISEEEKMQEIRRLFLIQVIKLFQERLKSAYKEKLSQERTQRLIEELEAEENAKKERELKRIRQKEKAKEKKRLQQLAKEEERRKKEEQEKAKEQEIRQKQEELKAEQKKKKEEAKKKREEEKRKRIEELQRKEEEQKRKLEAQRKKEETAKKAKEEKRRQMELESKAKEELENKRKEEEKFARSKEANNLVAPDHLATTVDPFYKSSSTHSGIFPAITKEFEEPPISAPNVDLKTGITDEALFLNDDGNDSAISPGKNVFLDKLSQARSSSLSNGTNSPSLIQPPSQILPSVLNSGSNQIPNSLLMGSEIKSNSPGAATQSPWNSGSHVRAPTSVQNHYQQPFSPFNGFQPENSNNPGLANNMWRGNAPRNNSIWQTPGARNNGLWQSSMSNIPPIAPDNEAIQLAAYNAFQLLQSSSQLEYGVAPSLLLFQSTKNLLRSPSLTYNQFLGACQSSALYIFECLYDDFGTVTHINVSAQFNPIAQPSQLTGSTMLPGHDSGMIVPSSMPDDILTNSQLQSSNAASDSQLLLQSLEKSSRGPLNGRTLWN